MESMLELGFRFIKYFNFENWELLQQGKQPNHHKNNLVLFHCVFWHLYDIQLPWMGNILCEPHWIGCSSWIWIMICVWCVICRPRSCLLIPGLIHVDRIITYSKIPSKHVFPAKVLPSFTYWWLGRNCFTPKHVFPENVFSIFTHWCG